MILYNVTVKVDEPIAGEWLLWMQQEHIPEVMRTGCFSEFRILRLLEVDDSEGPTYAVQYFAESKGLYNEYIDKYAANLRQKGLDRWGRQFMAFRSVMQVVD